MIISIVIPAYNASSTIGRTLDSVFAASLPQDWQIDAIVINDGSTDEIDLTTTVSHYPGITLLGYPDNRGKSSAMNMGIGESRGDVIMILDADDELVSGWPDVFADIINEWPDDAQICFAACRTQFGGVTANDPEYSGLLTFEDMLNDRHLGEYLPVFRGHALRAAGGYRDPQTSWCCPQWTYLEFAERAPLWVTQRVMRIYYVDQADSACGSLGRPDSALEIVHCYDHIFESFGDQYKRLAPGPFRRRRMRQAVFAAIANKRRKAFALWCTGATLRAPLETLAALVLIIIGGVAAFKIVGRAKRAGIIRQYG